MDNQMNIVVKGVQNKVTINADCSKVKVDSVSKGNEGTPKAYPANADKAETLTVRVGPFEADEAGPSTEQKIKRIEEDDDKLQELRTQNEAYQVHSNNTSEQIRKEVYDAKSQMPSEDCLDQCKRLIRYKESTEAYNLHFVVCEGLADTLRTNTELKVDLPKHDIYECIKMVAPLTSFPTIAKMKYRFRYAVALVIAGDVDGALRVSEKGNEILQMCLKDKCLATTGLSSLYGYINVRLGEFSKKAIAAKTDKRELKEKIIKMISEGLEKELLEDIDDKNMKKRMYLLKKHLAI